MWIEFFQTATNNEKTKQLKSSNSCAEKISEFNKQKELQLQHRLLDKENEYSLLNIDFIDRYENPAQEWLLMDYVASFLISSFRYVSNLFSSNISWLGCLNS